MTNPKPGRYRGIVDFIHDNSLESEFLAAVSGDRTIEAYLGDYPETQDLTRNIISDLSGGEWNGRVKFGNGHTKQFSFDK